MTRLRRSEVRDRLCVELSHKVADVFEVSLLEALRKSLSSEGGTIAELVRKNEGHNVETITDEVGEGESKQMCDCVWCRRKKKRCRECVDDTGDDEAHLLCVICTDLTSFGGAHKACALGCGHVFGMDCISKWLSVYGNERCPTCNLSAAVNEMRPIFPTRPREYPVRKDNLKKLKAEWAEKEAAYRKKIDHLLDMNVALHSALGPSMDQVDHPDVD